MSDSTHNLHPLVAAARRRARADAEADAQAGLLKMVREPMRIGLVIIIVFVAGSLGWASVARLSAGAIAPGVISPDGSRRTVQHLEGGIINTILVRDGDEVTEGQVLLVLAETQAAAMHQLLTEQAKTLVVTRARLMAEQAGNDAIIIPSGLDLEHDPGVDSIVSGQIALFERRRRAIRAQLAIIDERERQADEQIRALEAQVESASSQISLISEELTAKNTLLRQGLIPRPELLRLERTSAALQGERGRYLGAISEVRERISELGAQRISLEAEFAKEVAAELERVRAEYAQVSERLSASEDVLKRTTIVAPVAGRIVNSRFKTPGGVVRAGEAVLDIVPSGEKLLIDARVSPSDIDVVRAGLAAVVHLTAYSSRSLPRIDGVVRDVSADRLVDPDTGQPYFLARVEVLKEDLDRLDGEVTLMPGMPAEVMIVTGERTALAYFLEPFMTAMRRGLRES